MEGFRSLKEVWQYYDVVDRKKFYAHDISMAINSLPKDNPDAERCRIEAMAFDFSENCDGREWGTFYGPQWTFTKKDTDEEVYVPDIKSVTPNIIAYWESRANAVVNPMLKARYCGLVLEFKKRVTGEEPDYRNIKLANIKALLDVVEGDYCEHEIITFDCAERALTLAVRFHNKELQEKVAKAYFDANERLSTNDMLPGIWGRAFESLIKHRECFADYEGRLLKEQLDRFERLKTLALSDRVNTDQYAHVLSEQVELIADYYHSIGQTEKAEPYLVTLLDAIKAAIPVRGGLWGQGMLQQMQQRLRKYGFDKRANQLFVEVGDLGEKTLQELQTTEYSIPLEKERINAFLKEALKGSSSEVLLYFIVQYLPKLEEEKRKLKEKAERSPLLDMVPTVTIDSSGNAISRVGVGPNAERQKLYFSMYENMRFTIPFMHLHITKMKEEKKMTTESMMAMFEGSLLITDDHKEIVRRGFEAYITEDYMVCCHLLVPQLEAAIRRLFALNGANIMRAKKDPLEGNEYLSLDSLLGSGEAITYMGEDIANYYRNVLTDQYGWNIRNQVSHGLLTTDSFNFGMADRVVHAFLMLSVFKEKKQTE